MGYRPRIERGGVHLDLPLPLMKIAERAGRTVRKSTVPLQPGVLVSATTRRERILTFNGKIVIDNPQDADRARGVVDSITGEKSVMDLWLVENDEPFVFYRFIKGATIGGSVVGFNNTQDRWYEGCICTDLTFDWLHSTVRVLPYSFTVLVPDGVEWYKA